MLKTIRHVMAIIIVIQSISATALFPSAAATPTKPLTNIPQGHVITTGNDFYKVHLQSEQGSGIGLFTLSTGASFPTGSDLDMTYGKQLPGSSYLTIHSYTSGIDYIQRLTNKSDTQQTVSLDSFGIVTKMSSGVIRTIYTLPGGSITQDKLTIIQDISVQGDTLENSSITVRVSVINNDINPVQIGIRQLTDGEIAADDAPVLEIPSTAQSGSFQAMQDKAIPIIYNLNSKSGPFEISTATQGLNADVAISPDSIVSIPWSKGYDSPFINPLSMRSSYVDGNPEDSAVITYYGSTLSHSIPVPAGMSFSFTTLIKAAPAVDAITVTVEPKLAVVGQNVKFTVNGVGGADAGKITWSAPEGDTKNGTGSTFTTKFAKPGHQSVAIGGIADPKAPKSASVRVIEFKIEVDGETDPKKALIMAQISIGVKVGANIIKPLRPQTQCSIWVAGEPEKDITVWLINPDSRLRFNSDNKGDLKLVLPKNGDPESFILTGESASAAIGDAIIEAHMDAKDGPMGGKRPSTVYTFDPAKLTLTTPAKYGVVANKYQPVGDVALKMEGEASVKPDGVISGGMLGRIRITFAQNMLNFTDVLIVNKPVIHWHASAAAGATVELPSFIKEETKVTTLTNDTDNADDPLYSTKAAAHTRPKNLGGGTATATDSPFSSTRRVIPVRLNGQIIGDALYSLDKVTLDDHWITWLVAYDPTGKNEYPLREAKWDAVLDSSAADQKASCKADGAAATPPLRGKPFSNDAANDPNNKTTTNGPNITFINPGVASVTLTTATVKGDTALKGKVTLTQEAGLGGKLVGLHSSSADVSPDATVLVPQGAKTADFDVTTSAVAAKTEAVISATANGTKRTVKLTLTP